MLMKDPTLDHISQCEYWTIDRTTGSSNVTVTLSWDTRSCGVDVPTALKVTRWDGSQWRDHGNGGTTGSLTAGSIVTAGNVTAFSPFTLASNTSANPLPVELSHFNVFCENNAVIVDWRTESETENAFFTVETSTDAQNWSTLKIVPGAGNSSAGIDYRFATESSNSGTYYRLKQTDYDGHFACSEIVYLESCTTGSALVYPNPSNGMVHIRNTNENGMVTICSASGLVIRSVSTKTGNIDISDLPDGMYFIRVEEEHPVVCKLIKKS